MHQSKIPVGRSVTPGFSIHFPSISGRREFGSRQHKLWSKQSAEEIEKELGTPRGLYRQRDIIGIWAEHDFRCKNRRVVVFRTGNVLEMKNRRVFYAVWLGLQWNKRVFFVKVECVKEFSSSVAILLLLVYLGPLLVFVELSFYS